MNANELANALKDMESGWFDDLTLKEAATMLREQQAEIEALNQRIERMIENASHYEGIAHAGGFEAGWQVAKAKTLTDEEIRAIARNTYLWNQGKHEWSEVDFARAILKKASEK